MKKHGFDDELIQNNIINNTDRGSNMIKAMELAPSLRRLNDPCHLLAILAKRSSTPYKKGYLPEEYEIPREVRDSLALVEKTIKNCKKIINGVK